MGGALAWRGMAWRGVAGFEASVPRPDSNYDTTIREHQDVNEDMHIQIAIGLPLSACARLPTKNCVVVVFG